MQKHCINFINSNIYINNWYTGMSEGNNNSSKAKNGSRGKCGKKDCKHKNNLTLCSPSILCLLLFNIFGKFDCNFHLLAIGTSKYVELLNTQTWSKDICGRKINNGNCISKEKRLSFTNQLQQLLLQLNLKFNWFRGFFVANACNKSFLKFQIIFEEMIELQNSIQDWVFVTRYH